MKGSIYLNKINQKMNKIKFVDISKLKNKIKEGGGVKNLNKEKEKKDKRLLNRINTLFIKRISQNKSFEEENKENENSENEDNNEIDPRINFEKINKLNQSRPQTSYGGLNTRKKNLQSALKNSKFHTNINFFKNQ
jgi:hypothetical protein